MTAVDQLDVFDLADFHPGGPDELTRPQAADIAELRGIAVGPVEAHLSEHHDEQRSKEQQHHADDAELDKGTGDFHGLIVWSPIWRPQTYSAAYGEPVSTWLYGARLLPVSITSVGAGHRSRVMVCQHPGAPPGPPWALIRGRLSGETYGWGAQPTS